MTKHICIHCNYKTDDTSNFNRHNKSKSHLRCIENNSKYVNYKCDKCNYSTNHKNDFRKHKCNKIKMSTHIVELSEIHIKLFNQMMELQPKWSLLNEQKEYFESQVTCYQPSQQYYTITEQLDKIEDEYDKVDDKLIEYENIINKSIHYYYDKRYYFENWINNSKSMKIIKIKKKVKSH